MTGSPPAVPVSSWSGRVGTRNSAIAAAGRWRSLRPLDGAGPVHAIGAGNSVVSFASNDYLGLSAHPAVRAAAVDAVGRWGTGSGSSRLVAGGRAVHHELEAALAAWRGTAAALVFPTGYAANLGVLTTFATEGVLVVSDERNHASIIDGCRLSRAQVAVSRHLDVEHVAELVRDHDGPAIVVTERVFSMDGDLADLDALAGVCGEWGALLVVDEAHAVLPPAWKPPEGVDVLRVGTLSKALASLGGFVAGPRTFVDLLVNVARPFIFTTAPPPAAAAAALAALGVVQGPEGVGLVARLRANLDRLAPASPGPIVAVVLGAEDAALAASAQLMEMAGLLVPAIRPPAVAPGTSRLRVTLSAAHTEDHVARLVAALATLSPR